MRKNFILPLLVLAAACTVEGPEDSATTVLTVDISSEATKTYMDPDTDQAGEHHIYWSDGDCLSLNGTASSPLTGISPGTTSANFSFQGVINPPYSILYPAAMWKDANTITLPAEQSYSPGSFASGAEPLAGHTTDGSNVSIQHLCAMVKVSVKKDSGVSASDLTKVIFKGKGGEQVCGDFTIDYTEPSISGASAAEECKSLTVNVGAALSEDSAMEIVLVVPAGEYSSGFTVELVDQYARKMTKARNSSITLTPGKLTVFPEFNFVPSPTTTELGIPNIQEEVVVPDGINVTGRVVDDEGTPLEGVVVSDGTKCVKTMFDGTFYIESTIADVKFVFVSTPSCYMPQVEDGIPKFYKAKADVTPSGGVYDFGDFVLTPVANPDRYTLLITADPQPRQYQYWNNDRIAFKSLDACEDLYDELADVAASITDRQVYGICLGDLVHEDMDLFDNYDAGLAQLGFPTYNVIGNHDNDPSASDDDSAAATFEAHYGPRNYSFNIGGIHYVVLDNLIMKANPNNDNKLTSFDQGLTDQIWTWLQNDLAYIPVSTKLMVCAHSPMFRQISGSERSNTALHGPDYGDLINNYSEIHAWAGHTHVGFNYNYPTSHRHKRVQVHTLARSTGELWTNEYLAAGTPRGFTIVEVDHGNITWKFHPITRQTGDFVGVSSGICSAGAPAYNWRDWDYNASGVAVMHNGGCALTEDYQLHVYPRGAYGDEYVYANVFLWDDKWGLPVWTPDGGSPVTMTLLHDSEGTYIADEEKVYDLANTEFKSHYKANVGFFRNDDGYPASEIGEITTMFRAPASASPASGTVSVTDRFGNTYTRHVSW